MGDWFARAASKLKYLSIGIAAFLVGLGSSALAQSVMLAQAAASDPSGWGSLGLTGLVVMAAFWLMREFNNHQKEIQIKLLELVQALLDKKDG